MVNMIKAYSSAVFVSCDVEHHQNAVSISLKIQYQLWKSAFIRAHRPAWWRGGVGGLVWGNECVQLHLTIEIEIKQIFILIETKLEIEKHSFYLLNKQHCISGFKHIIKNPKYIIVSNEMYFCRNMDNIVWHCYICFELYTSWYLIFILWFLYLWKKNEF